MNRGQLQDEVTRLMQEHGFDLYDVGFDTSYSSLDDLAIEDLAELYADLMGDMQ